MKCNIEKKRCLTHGCDTIATKVSSKKWKWIVKKKEYGFVNSKTTKYLCKSRIRGCEVPDSATSQADHRLGDVSDEVGRFSVENDRADYESRDLR